MAARMLVDIRCKDHERVAKRIRLLDGVESVVEVEEAQRDQNDKEQSLEHWDVLVKCRGITSRFDVEELLMGVPDLHVEVQ